MFSLSLFGEEYTSADAEFFPTLDTDLSVSCNFTPPVSLFLPAVYLAKYRGLPLEEFAVSDGKRSTLVLRRKSELFLPVFGKADELYDIPLTDSGVDIKLSGVRIFDNAYLLFACDDLALFDKRLAPRIVAKCEVGSTLIVYEKQGEKINFFAYQNRQNRAVLPTSAYILALLFGARSITSGNITFDFPHFDGKKYMAVKI